MADDVVLNGNTNASREIAGVKYQRVMLTDKDGNNLDSTHVMPTALYDGSGNLLTSLPVLGNSVQINATFARPADTVAYSAGDAISNSTSAPTVLTFTGIARTSGGTGYITKALAMTDQKANTARLRLHLFSTAPTAINDNQVQTILWANRASYLGYIDFAGMATEDATSSTAAASLNTSPRLPFTTNGSANIFGLPETLDAFTPASAQNFFFALHAEQN